MAIDWKTLPQAEAMALLRAGLEWRAQLVRDLQGLEADVQAQHVRPVGRPRKNGLSAPDGDLGRESAGEA